MSVTNDHERQLHSVEDLAAEQAENGEMLEDDDGQQLLDFGDDLNLTVRGSRPTASAIKIRSVRMPIKGQLGDAGDDDTITVLMTARRDDLQFPVTRASDGTVAGKTRVHVFTPTSVFAVDPAQANTLLGIEE
jgi:hypothetical protein